MSRVCLIAFSVLLLSVVAAAGVDALRIPSQHNYPFPLSYSQPSHFLDVTLKNNLVANGAAVSKSGKKFFSLPRVAGNYDTFSVGYQAEDGIVYPFPGGDWNTWSPNGDSHRALVYINAIHIFKDDTLWVVDTGVAPNGSTVPGGPKVVQFDPYTGNVLQILYFNEEILPPGSAMNDLRIHDEHWMFITDSGLGGIIVHDMKTGQTLRRLSKSPVTRDDDHKYLYRGRGGRILRGPNGTLPDPKSNQLEVDPEGKWFYFSTQAGPLRRVLVKDLLDAWLTEEELTNRVHIYYDIGSTDGTGMDSLGNIYVSSMVHQSVFVIAADNSSTQTLVQSDRLISPDALFIDLTRRIYIPAPQFELLPSANDGVNGLRAPYYVYSLELPRQLGSITLGDQLG